MTTETRPELALVLSSGAARGYAHLGVLKVLESAGLTPDLVVGSSFGALVGSAYAAGRTPTELVGLAQAVNWRTLAALADIGRPSGLLAGERLERFYSDLVEGRDFEHLDVPAVCVATDLVTAEPVTFHSGSVARAIRASTAIPGLFTPVARDGRVLVDGALSAALPLEPALASGARVILAVDVTSAEDTIPRLAEFSARAAGQIRLSPRWLQLLLPDSVRVSVPTLFRLLAAREVVVRQSTMSLKPSGERILIHVRPNVQRIRWYQFTAADVIIGEGERAAEQTLPLLEKALLASPERATALPHSTRH